MPYIAYRVGGFPSPTVPAGLVFDYEEFGVESEQGFEYIDHGDLPMERLAQ